MKITYANLLIISDDEVKIEALTTALGELKLYAVTIANGLAHLAELMASRAFDIILLDVAVAKRARWMPDEEALLAPVPVPIIMLAYQEELPEVSAYVAAGAADYLMLPTDSTLLKARVSAHLQKRLLQEQAVAVLQSFNEMEKLADDLRLVILPLAIDLSSEGEYERVLERIVIEAKSICNADAGTLYLRTPDNTLRFAIVRTNSLGIAFGGTTGQPVPYADIPLYDAAGAPNYSNVASYVALQGFTVNIADVYHESGFDFSGTRAFDERNQYRSISCLTVPLKNDQVIGVLQLINAQDPQTGAVAPFDVYHQLVAESLASQAALVLHNRKLRASEESLLRYKRELQIGRSIQMSFFPAELPELKGHELVASFKAAREVSGDFYDAFALPHGKVALVIADVCDKGVVAALFMALVRSLVRAFMQQHYYLAAQRMQAALPQAAAAQSHKGRRRSKPRPFPMDDAAALLDVVRLTNAYIGSNHSHTHMFATLFFAVYDPADGELLYVNCGHVLPLVFDRAGITARLAPTGPAVGLRADARYATARVRLAAGDTLLAYTDGLTEARDPAGNLLREARVLELLAQEFPTAQALLAALETAVRDFTGDGEPFDDVTLLALRRLEKSDAAAREADTDAPAE